MRVTACSSNGSSDHNSIPSDKSGLTPYKIRIALNSSPTHRNVDAISETPVIEGPLSICGGMMSAAAGVLNDWVGLQVAGLSFRSVEQTR